MLGWLLHGKSGSSKTSAMKNTAFRGSESSRSRAQASVEVKHWAKSRVVPTRWLWWHVTLVGKTKSFNNIEHFLLKISFKLRKELSQSINSIATV